MNDEPKANELKAQSSESGAGLGSQKTPELGPWTAEQIGALAAVYDSVSRGRQTNEERLKLIAILTGNTIPTALGGDNRAVSTESSLQPKHNPDDWVAWCHYVIHGQYEDSGADILTIEMCDSDAKGAFKVYRAVPAVADSPSIADRMMAEFQSFWDRHGELKTRASGHPVTEVERRVSAIYNERFAGSCALEEEQSFDQSITRATGYSAGWKVGRDAARFAVLEQRCERGTAWDAACVACAEVIRSLKRQDDSVWAEIKIFCNYCGGHVPHTCTMFLKRTTKESEK